MAKYLIIARAKHPVPEDVQAKLMTGVESWLEEVDEYVDAAYSFAGKPGGVVIADVDTLEKLDHLAYSYPVYTYSDVEILPLVDVPSSHEALRRALDVRKAHCK